MSKRDEYPPGAPCWVDTLQADADAAARFYGELFGWEPAGPGRCEAIRRFEYYVARLGGDDVAGIGSPRPANADPAWNTYVRVESADAAVARARAAGGEVLAEPFDAPPAGRLAVLPIPPVRPSASGRRASATAPGASTSPAPGR